MRCEGLGGAGGKPCKKASRRLWIKQQRQLILCAAVDPGFERQIFGKKSCSKTGARNFLGLGVGDLRTMRPAVDVLPADLVAILPKRRLGRRGPQKAPVKQLVTLRLDRDVIERFRATGEGCQARVNAALKKPSPQPDKSGQGQ